MVSIVIPVYNGEGYLAGCIQSAIDQDMRDIEILVVDNNSSDRTADVALDFTNIDQRVKYFFCPDGMVGGARNCGLGAAQGEYVLFLDSDDRLMTNAVSTLYSRAAEYGADITACNIMYHKGDKEYPQDSKGKKDIFAADKKQIAKLFYDKLRTYIMYNVFKLYKTSFLRDCGLKFNTGLSLGEDVIFNFEAFSKSGSVYYTCDPLYIHNIVFDGLNFKYRPDAVEIKTVLSKCLKDFMIQHGIFDHSYYITVLNDVFMLIVNEKKSEGDIEKILSLEITRELLHSRVFWHLPIRKNIVFICMKLGLTDVLNWAASFWIKA